MRYKCPGCPGGGIVVEVRTNMRLVQHENGEIETDDLHSGSHDHHWDENSTMTCMACGFCATAWEFDTVGDISWKIDDAVDPLAIVPAGTVCLPHVWGFLCDSTELSDTRSFYMETDGTETVRQVWRKLEQMVRKYHKEHRIETRTYWLEALHTRRSNGVAVTDLLFGT